MHKLIVATTIGFFAFILGVIYLANTGGSSIFFDFVRSIPYGDKLGHAGLFGTLTFLAVVASKFSVYQCGKLKIYYGAALVALFVIGEELSQAFIPSRTFDYGDLAADSVGIVTASCLAYLVSKLINNKYISYEERLKK